LSAVESLFLELQISATGVSSWASLRRQASSATAAMCSWSSLALCLTSMAAYFNRADVNPFSVRLAAEVT